MLRLGVVVVVLGTGCAPRGESTPEILVSPGARDRIVMMDRFRHHGDVRRWLPRVTVEEVDDVLSSTPANAGDGDAGAHVEPPYTDERTSLDESVEPSYANERPGVEAPVEPSYANERPGVEAPVEPSYADERPAP